MSDLIKHCIEYRPVVDLRGARGTRAPPPGGPNSFNFMQFRENMAKSYVGAPLGSWRPLLGEIWIRHCRLIRNRSIDLSPHELLQKLNISVEQISYMYASLGTKVQD